MDNKQYEVMSVTNVSDYDFPYIDTKALNKTIVEQRMAGGSQTERVYNKPEVPTLMWDSECYALEAGETRQFPRFMAENFAKKIVDRAIIEKISFPGIKNNVGMKGIRVETLRKSILELVLIVPTTPEAVEAVEEKEEEDPKPVEPKEVSKVEKKKYEGISRNRLMKMALDQGLDVKSTMKKVELIEVLYEANA